MTTVFESLERRRQEWISVVNRSDLGGYLGLLTDDVVWFPPGQPAIQGKQNFAAWVRPFFDRFSYEFSVLGFDVRTAGDWAVERGTFLSRLSSPGSQEAAEHSGRYLVIWRREPDGIWRIERYIDETA